MAINYPNYGSAGLSAEAGVIDKQQRCIQSWWGVAGVVVVFLGREEAAGICSSSTLALLKQPSIRATQSTLSASAQTNRQLVFCGLPLIFHISLWRDIIPDDCLSVMLYDEKCWGPLMGDSVNSLCLPL